MSCLFDSLSFFIKLDSNIIRQIICNYLESNNNIIEGLDTNVILSLDMPKDHYITNMRNMNTWGGAIEIQAACNIWGIKIVVVNKRDNNTIIEFIPLNKKFNHMIGFIWNGIHFEPIQIKGSAI